VRDLVRRRALVAIGLIGLFVALWFTPTPYWIVAPGFAVDLRSRVIVDGYAAPAERYFLTDVIVAPASVLMLAARFVPGVRLVARDAIAPAGVSMQQYDRVLDDAMSTSQDVAAVVAERAAGLHVPDPPQSVAIERILPESKAGAAFRTGDVLISIEGRPVAAAGDIAKVIRKLTPGTLVRVVVRREGRTVSVRAPTIATAAGTRFGIALASRSLKPELPVAVRFDLKNISGSSGGLMFALEIYGALHPNGHLAWDSIAGTGTLALDGRVGPIEGTPQKLIAAKRAGARVFFVPRENYADISSEQGIRIVPVGRFGDALAALRPEA
jgi:PDZ domain-containing protein